MASAAAAGLLEELSRPEPLLNEPMPPRRHQGGVPQGQQHRQQQQPGNPAAGGGAGGAPQATAIEGVRSEQLSDSDRGCAA